MLARFDLQFRRPGALTHGSQKPALRWVLLSLAGVLLAAWLIYRHVLRPSWLQQMPGFLLDSFTIVEAAAVVTLGVLVMIFYWRSRRRERLNNPVVADLYALSPADFERYVAGLFRKKGYTVRVRGRSGDHGVDLELLRPDGRRAIVQCKRYRNTIGPDIVRELLGTMIHEQVHHAFLVTTADISPAAREWAQTKPMTLIDGQTLVALAEALNENGRHPLSAWQ
jgi:restriction system protein